VKIRAFSIGTILFLFLFFKPAFAQDITTQLPTSSTESAILKINQSLNKLNNASSKVFSDVSLLQRLEFYSNLFSSFSTILLGIFALVSGLLIWNAYGLRQEAKENLKEIRDMNNLAKRLMEKQKEEFNKFKERADSAMQAASISNRKILDGLTKQASEGGAEIKKLLEEAKKSMALFNKEKTLYSNASPGTATFFETPPPLTGSFSDYLVGKRKPSSQSILDIANEREKKETGKEDKT